MEIGIIIFLIGFFSLAWYRLDWALLVIVFGLPSYLIRFNLGPLPLTILESMILITSLVWLIKDFVPNNKEWLKWGGHRPLGRINYPYAWEMVAVLVISLLAVLVANFSLDALGIWKAYFFEPILLFILILNVFKQKQDLDRLLGALTMSALVISLISIYQQVTGQFITNPFWAAAATRRVTSVFGYPNAVGLYLAPISLLLTSWLASFKNRQTVIARVAVGLVIIMSWLAIYFAKSEGALVAVIAGLGLLGLLASRRSRIITLTLSALVLAGLLLQPTTRSWTIDKITLRDLSGEIRKQQWRETATLLQNGHLVTGSGLANYQASVAPYHQDGIFFNYDNLANFDSVVWASSTLRMKYWQPVEIYIYPHNIFLNFWTELGLAGLFIFIWLIGKTIVKNWQTMVKEQDNLLRYLSLGVIISLVAIVIHGLVDVPYFKNDLAAMFWIILALSAMGQLNKTLKDINIKS